MRHAEGLHNEIAAAAVPSQHARLQRLRRAAEAFVGHDHLRETLAETGPTG